MVKSFLQQNWVEIGTATIGLISVISGLVAHASSKKKSRVDVSFSIAEAHKEIWSQFLQSPSLNRVMSDSADLKKEPVTAAEETFVVLLLAHLATTLEAIDKNFHECPEGLIEDVTKFYSKPIPQRVLQKHIDTQPEKSREIFLGIFGREISTTEELS